MNQFVQVQPNDLGRPINIISPRSSNFHAHFRWGSLFDAVAPAIMRHHKYVLAMPNQGPGEGDIIRTIEDGIFVYDRIMRKRDECGIMTFDHPLITLYHTADITPAVIERIARQGIVRAVKNYPVHRSDQKGTTGSGLGVPFDECDEVIRAMEDNDVPLLIHAEDVNDHDGKELPDSIRESHCVNGRLWKFRERHPRLRLCIEHASTIDAIEFVKADNSGKTVMTATPHHQLFIDQNLWRYSWANHLSCKPRVKGPTHRNAVRAFATSGDFRCIAGDDTAPHPSKKKIGKLEDVACGCWMPHAIALYTLAFTHEGSMDDRFAQFMSFNGPDWWGLPRPSPEDTITIRAESRNDIPPPTAFPEGNDVIIPLGWTTEGDRLKVGFVAG